MRDFLVTYSLGSSIGVAIWDAEARVGDLLHYMLPESSHSPAKAKNNPAMLDPYQFTDLSLTLMSACDAQAGRALIGVDSSVRTMNRPEKRPGPYGIGEAAPPDLEF